MTAGEKCPACGSTERNCFSEPRPCEYYFYGRMTDDDKCEWVDHPDVQELLKWLEQCTLAELMLAREFIEKQRGLDQ